MALGRAVGRRVRLARAQRRRESAGRETAAVRHAGAGAADAGDDGTAGPDARQRGCEQVARRLLAGKLSYRL